ncbi:hypothetical protein EJ02DRAFT_9561 [Clathrospora elynae]|uniref:Uncharacterized protein n=1 Tax=Clathrospora elynae TaxID=706981 RepID=A0A6A5T773_9PLEO|nr:hypothetical protein EJ02DRAFT_9561 [Clathrospora elynae]
MSASELSLLSIHSTTRACGTCDPHRATETALSITRPPRGSLPAAIQRALSLLHNSRQATTLGACRIGGDGHTLALKRTILVEKQHPLQAGKFLQLSFSRMGFAEKILKPLWMSTVCKKTKIKSALLYTSHVGRSSLLAGRL